VSGYLFDTCIVRNWFSRNPAVVGRVNLLPGTSPLFISSITLGEIECGHTSPAATDLAKQAEFRRFMREHFDVPALPVTGDSAIHYAQFRRRLFDKYKRCGKYTEQHEDLLGEKVNIDENDLWLVAQACERNLVFVTHDRMTRIREIVGSDVTVEIWPQT
jgi:tRNA(fMet)-specific endonuclease VapC